MAARRATTRFPRRQPCCGPRLGRQASRVYVSLVVVCPTRWPRLWTAGWPPLEACDVYGHSNGSAVPGWVITQIVDRRDSVAVHTYRIRVQPPASRVDREPRRT